MGKTDLWTIILSIIAIAVTLVSFVEEKYRILIISMFTLFIAAYFLYEMYVKIEKNSFETNRLNEKIKIHEDLINIKTDINLLKREVYKNEQ